jgi:hypothetical protein
MVLMSALAVFVSAIIFYIGTTSWSFNIHALPIDIIVHALVICFMIFFQICLIYAVITASHILPRFRFAAGCGMYLAIMYILQETVFRFVGGNAVTERGMHIFGDGAVSSLLPMGLAALVLAALFFWTTGFLLKRSYNLE